MTNTDNAFYYGKIHADSYEPEELLEILQSGDVWETYKALGAISKLKFKDALETLKNMALYDEDLGIQDEAVRTIRRIGRRKALDILDLLKSTNHKELVEMILKHGADYEY